MTRTCTRCLYDENVPGISFDDRGICNYCKVHDRQGTGEATGIAGRVPDAREC